MLDQLKRGWSISNICYLCKGEEIVDQIFLHCLKIVMLWWLIVEFDILTFYLSKKEKKENCICSIWNRVGDAFLSERYPFGLTWIFY